MPTVRDALIALEKIAPRRYAFSFDKVGLQVGDSNQQVQRAVVSLDRSLGAVNFAIESQAQLLLAHHPLIFNPLETVDTRSHQGRTVLKLIQHGISFVAAHTNWDSAVGGVNDTLCQIFKLSSVLPFGSGADVRTSKLVVTCPRANVDEVIDAASEAGAGIVGAYRRCAFVSPGEGTYVGDHSTHPAIGVPEREETVEELRIEMNVADDRISAVERAMSRVHPYEQPAIDFYSLRSKREMPAGRVGTLPAPISLAEFAMQVDQFLDVRSWTWGDPTKRIKRVAFVGGAGDSDWIEAQKVGADLLVTGEVKQHIAVEATESGMTLIAAGHYQTEQPGVVQLAARMRAAMPEVEWSVFTPPIGLYGRPM